MELAVPDARGMELAMPPRPLRRLRAKTPPPRRAQQTLPEPLVLEDETADDKKRALYFITFPRPLQERASTGEKLVAPESKTKSQMLSCLLDACERPVYVDAKSITMASRVAVVQTGIWRECAAGHIHDHAPLMAAASFRYMPVKRALLQRHGLASHWSCSHLGYYSMVRYVVVPSPRKPLACLDAFPELSPGHPALEDCVHQPITAAALGAKRLRVEQKAAEKGKPDPRVTDMDIWALVVRSGIRNTTEDPRAHLRLGQYAKAHCGEAMVQALFRLRHKLPSLIDDIWEWESLDDIVAVTARSRVELLDEAAAKPCACGGAWKNFVLSSFRENGINPTELCKDVYKAMLQGRSEDVPVIVLAGATGGEGKSAFFKALFNIFRVEHMVFARPGKGSFPFLQLPEAKVVFLDEWRFDAEVLPWALQCLWYDGSAVPITRPQNQAGASGHVLYKGTAPIFVTCKLPDLEWLEYKAQVDPVTGSPYDAEASMIPRRLKIYRFTRRVQKPPQKFEFCAACFATMVLGLGGAF
jgi:hypothetical protein